MCDRVQKHIITPDGEMYVIDPGYDFLDMLPESVEINSQPPQSGFIPAVQITRSICVPGISKENLSSIETPRLWEIHERILNESNYSNYESGTCTLLDLKAELAEREIANCGLCGWNCTVNRLEKKGTHCRLDAEASYSFIFTHISEEPVITPCVTIVMSGCSLKCKTCNATESLNPGGGKKLTPKVWQEIRKVAGYGESVAIAVGGGNPDESAFQLLKAVRKLPADINKPIVWNNNGFASPVLYKLLNGIVDVWLPDFKFGTDECGQQIAGVKNYFEVASRGVEEMTQQDARIIIRIPILPGHVECCCRNILEHLGKYRNKIFISPLEYLPTTEISGNVELNRMVTDEEISRVRFLISANGLRDIFEYGNGFWR